MRVTEVDIAFVKPKNGLIAFASVVLDDQLYLSGIAVHSKLAGSGYRLTYPTRRVGETQFSLSIRFAGRSGSRSSTPSSKS
jgi:hypothetical protein